MNDNEMIAKWLGNDYYCAIGKLAVSPSDWTEEWSPSTDMLLWHGEDGLLQKIEEKSLRTDFIQELWALLRPMTGAVLPTHTIAWLCLKANPSQLTEALVKTIKV